MKPIRIKAIAKKELIQIIRDPISLVLAFLLPVMLLFIYGYAITFDVDNIATVVCDMDQSNQSRELVARFRESHYFTIVSYVDSYKDVDRFIDRGRAKVGILIPVDFSKEIARKRPARVEVILDGGDSNTATIAQGYINAIAERFSFSMGERPMRPPVDVRSRVWYNTDLKSRNFIIPGLIAVIMAVIIALLTSLTVAREWDRGTMEQLISTPLKTPELILGKLAPYFAIGVIDTILAMLMATILFGVPLRGSPVLLLILSSIFLFGGLSLGILISIVAKTQLIASQMAMFTSFLPAFMLSGFIFTISNMPAPLQGVTYIVSARYFVTILKGIFLKGSTLRLLLFESLLLALFAAVVFLLANKAFRKRID
jgi:ABC-2 type transport system permease protein